MPHLYLAPWEWRSIGPTGGLLGWHQPADFLGVLDIRGPAKAGIPDDPDPGYGFVVLPIQQTIDGARYLGQDIEAQMRVADRDFLASLGLQVTETQILRVIREIFANPDIYDPTGQTGPKPFRIGRRRGFEIVLGGFGRIVREGFSQGHTAFAATLAVRRVDFTRHANAGIPLAVLERWNGHDLQRLFGRDPRANFDDIRAVFLPDDADLPEAYRNSGARVPATVITESFNQTDSTTLGPDLTWVEVHGDFETVSNEVANADMTASGTPTARVTTALSGDDHYVELNVTDIDSGTSDQLMGVAGRHSTDAHADQEWYSIFPYQFDDKLYGWKRVGGTESSISTVALTLSIPEIYRIEVESATVRGYQAGTLRIEQGDSDITNNLYTGLISYWGQGDQPRGDSFEAGDLGTANPKGPLGMPLHGPFGGPV